jgi:hypothetical protein
VENFILRLASKLKAARDVKTQHNVNGHAQAVQSRHFIGIRLAGDELDTLAP